MNVRERFLETMDFNTSVRTLDWEFGYWGATVENWYKEGLIEQNGLYRKPGFAETICGPAIVYPLGETKRYMRDKDIAEQLDLDDGFEKVKFNTFVYPQFEERILDETEEEISYVNYMGLTLKRKKNDSTIAKIVAAPITNDQDWERYKEERLQVRYNDRKPDNWDKLIKRYRERIFPLSISGPVTGFFGVLRYLFGEPQIYYMYYDNPKLIHKINSHLCDLWTNLFSEILQKVDVDCAHFWEDMSGRQGSLISDAHFKEFMSPYYERLTGFLKSRGVRYFFIDTDGNPDGLIPLFIQCGVNGMYPFEVQAGADIVKTRMEYPDLLIMGGINKRVLAQSKEAIDRELEGKLPFMLKNGGFVPYADHIIPPDVNWENFEYYRKKIKKYIGK